MSFSETLRNYCSAAQSVATIFALGLGAVWTWLRFFQFREAEPKVAVNVEVNFIRKQAGQWVVMVEGIFKNESKVHYKFKTLTLKISYTLPEDELQNKRTTGDDGRDIYLSPEFPHTVIDTSWLDDAEDPDGRLDYMVLEPGESDRWPFVVWIPLNATMVRADRELLYDAQKGLFAQMVDFMKSDLPGKGIAESEDPYPESQEATKVVAVPKSDPITGE
jgi:hypothetical protein